MLDAALEEFARSGLPRRVDRRDRAAGRDLAAVPLPALRLEEGALPRGRARAASGARSRPCSRPQRACAARRRSRRWATPTGSMLEHRSADAPGAAPDVRGRARRRRRPRRPCATATATSSRTPSESRAPTRRLARFFATGCCSTSSPPWVSTRSPSPSRGPPACWPAAAGGGGVARSLFPVMLSNQSLHRRQRIDDRQDAHPLDLRRHLDRALHGRARQPRRLDRASR